MNAVTNFKEQFRQLLKDKIRVHNRQVQCLADLGEEYASILERIRSNITEIFLKMFIASWEDITTRYNRELKRIAAENPSFQERAHRVFLYYLDTIPKTWKADLEKAKKHGDSDRESKIMVMMETQSDIEKLYLKIRHQMMEVPS